jgi:hypothetical protein
MNRITVKGRRGFALPVVLMALFILTGALASGFAMLRGERAADDATLQADAAAALAETGLQQGMNNRAGLGLSALPTATPDSARLTLAGGYVDVITTRLREPVGEAVPGLYFVRTRGVRTRTGVAGAGNAVATASSFATYQIITMTVQSAMTGINGINKAGGAGVISGFDVCGQKPALPAVAVPTDPGMTGSGPFLNTLEGSEKISEIGGTKQDAADAVPIDWDAIVNENAISAQFNLPSDEFPPATWWAANPLAWPTIIVRNGPDPSTEFILPTKGRGLLIIFGDLNLNGNAAGWDGLVLVGGRLRSNGANEVQGGTITGLNVKLGFNVEDNDVNELNGTKEYKYNSCHIASALNGSGGGSLRPYQSTFANSFPTY